MGTVCVCVPCVRPSEFWRRPAAVITSIGHHGGGGDRDDRDRYPVEVKIYVSEKNE